MQCQSCSFPRLGGALIVALSLCAQSQPAGAGGDPTWTLVMDQTVVSTPSQTLTRSLRSLALSDDDSHIYGGFIQKSQGAGVREYLLSGDPPTGAATAFFNVTGVSPSGADHQPKAVATDDLFVYIGSSKDSTSGHNARVFIMQEGLAGHKLFVLDDISFPGFTGERVGGLATRDDNGVRQLYVARFHPGSAWVERYIVTGSTVASSDLQLDPTFNGTGQFSLHTDGGHPSASGLRGIAVADDGTIFVVSRDDGLLYRISSDLTGVATIALTSPIDVALFAGRAFVTQYNGNNSSVAEVMQSSLSILREFDAFADFPRDPGPDGDVAGYAGITIDADGHIFLADQFYFRDAAQSQDRILRSSPLGPPPQDPTLSLVATQSCYHAGHGNTITVEINMSDMPVSIVGGQFFIEYDTSVLTFVDAEPGDDPFDLEVFFDHDGVAGTLDYAVGISDFLHPGVSSAHTLARLTFTAPEICQDSMIDGLVSWRAHDPPTRLTGAGFPPPAVHPDLIDLGEFAVDLTPPVIVCPPDVTVQCVEHAAPGLPFASITGGVAIYYNDNGQGEIPSNQAYMRAQVSDANTNGGALAFSSVPLTGAGPLTWQFLFGDQGQFGFDLILPVNPDGTVSVPALIAVDNTNSTPGGAIPAGPVLWAINDYKGASPNGPANPATSPVNSLFRGPSPPTPLDVVITRNDLSVSGSVFTAVIEGYLESDGLIHWFDPGTPGSNGDGTTNTSVFAMTGRYYFAGTLTYDASQDPYPLMDFYEGTITLTANAPSDETGFATAVDNCTLFPVIGFSDIDNGGAGCPGDPLIITRTWTATDDCGNTSSCVQTITVIDDTAPSIQGVPDDITVYAEAGTCSAVVSWIEPVATDNCSAVTMWSTHQPGDVFPQGTATVTYFFEDGCGNLAQESFDVTVLGSSLMIVDLALQANVASPLTRCITFELFDTSGNLVQSVSEEITFTNGAAVATVEVPCGLYNACLTARDVLHTLRSTGNLSIVGTDYLADGFTPLRGGNFNDDEWIDILDFGIFVGQFNANYGTGDTTCATPPPHADATGDGLVTTADFTFIQANFLQQAEFCFVPLMSGGHPARRAHDLSKNAAIHGPITRISVTELRRRGLGHLVVADLNGDGWLDEGDIVAWLGGARP